MQHDVLSVADFLVHQKILDVGSLIARQLNNFPNLLILLHGTVAREVLLEGLANSLHVQIVCQACHGRDTFPPISLLNTDVYFFFRIVPSLVPGVLKCVYSRGTLLVRKLDNSRHIVLLPCKYRAYLPG